MTPLFGGEHQFSISFYEKGRINLVPPMTPQFMQGGETRVDKGVMLFYEQRMGRFPPFASFYGGVNLGRWNKEAKDVYTSTFFFSSKFWVLPIPFFHPYIEVSTFGPTFLFQGFSTPPRVVFQNFLGIGLELGGSLGLVIDLRMIRYYTKDLTVAHEGLKIPALLSVGCLF